MTNAKTLKICTWLYTGCALLSVFAHSVSLVHVHTNMLAFYFAALFPPAMDGLFLFGGIQLFRYFASALPGRALRRALILSICGFAAMFAVHLGAFFAVRM